MNIFDSALSRLKEAAKYEKIPDWFLASLSMPERTIDLNFSFKKDSGEIEMIQAYRVQYNNLLGPYKGGLRYHPEVNMDEVKSLSFWMMIKNAIANIPFGGGKGGIAVDPKTLSEDELKRMTKEFTKELTPNIGPYIDVPAPDVNTNSKIMDWIAEEFKVQSLDSARNKGSKFKIKYGERETKAVVTGKSVNKGGSLGREEATGLGGFYILELLIKKLNLKKPLTVAVQGFGNVGSHIAELLHKNGFLVVGLSDSKGAIFDQSGKGFNVPLVKKCKEEKGLISHCYCIGTVCDLAENHHATITNEELLEKEVDILIPAALENVIIKENASKIKARIIFEMANGPVSAEADKILSKNKVTVVPDVLANSGGVTVSYFEWYQNINNEKWSPEKVNEKLKEKMIKAFEKVWKISQEYKVSLRIAAYVLALRRLSEKAKL